MLCMVGVKQQAALACLVPARPSVGWAVCENDRTCQQIASLLAPWSRTMGHHMPKLGNEWSSFVLAPWAPTPPTLLGLRPTQTDEPTLCHGTVLLSTTESHKPTTTTILLYLIWKVNPTGRVYLYSYTGIRLSYKKMHFFSLFLKAALCMSLCLLYLCVCVCVSVCVCVCVRVWDDSRWLRSGRSVDMRY